MAAAAANPPINDIPDDDELEAILNGTLNGQDIFDVSNLEPPTQPSRPSNPAAGDSGLGIDEEVKVVKKRDPIPKLDDDRLLSDPGIPKLRRISKERLKFKGKGHEYGDIARMLNMYQFWLDELYPRAKFADGLAMIEKLGHSKRVQMMRKEWIDEGKPKHNAREDEDEDVVEIANANESVQRADDPMAGVQGQMIRSVEEDARSPVANGARGPSAPPDEPDDDELDALLADDPAPAHPSTAAAANTTINIDDDDPFADAMEAMADMEGMW